MTTQTPAPFTVAEVESGLQVRSHRGQTRVGACMMVVDLTNNTAEPLTVTPLPLDLLDAKGKRAGKCNWERAVVWEGNDHRRKYQAFKFPLAAGEKVRVKLFYGFEGKGTPKGELHYKGAFKAGEYNQTVESSTFKPDLVGDEI